MDLTKVPPHNKELEAGIVSLLMMSRDAIDVASEILDPDDMYHTTYSELYKTILSLYNDNVPVDVLTVSDTLKDTQLYTTLGGHEGMEELFSSSITAGNVRTYCEKVKEYSDLRKLIHVCREAEHSALDVPDDISGLISLTEQSIYDIARDRIGRKKIVTIKHAVSELLRYIEEPSAHDMTPISIPSIADTLGGLYNGNMIVIGARPSVGKTAIGLQLAYDAAKVGCPTLFVSLEMPDRQIATRIVSMETGIPVEKILNRTITGAEVQNIAIKSLEITKHLIYIDDTSELTPLQLKAKVRRLDSILQERGGLRLLVVDYLQIMTPTTYNKNDNSSERYGTIANGLKSIAKDLDIPVIVLSQLNRDVEKRGGRARLSDLRESGAIEQNADVVAILERIPDTHNRVSFSVLKQRNGAVGNIELEFLPQRCMFKDVNNIDNTAY